MDPQDTQNLVASLNRIADEIAAHLAWMREQKEAEDARRTVAPPVEYRPRPLDIQQRLLNGQWPKRDGNDYGNVTRLPVSDYSKTGT